MGRAIRIITIICYRCLGFGKVGGFRRILPCSPSRWNETEIIVEA